MKIKLSLAFVLLNILFLWPYLGFWLAYNLGEFVPFDWLRLAAVILFQLGFNLFFFTKRLGWLMLSGLFFFAILVSGCSSITNEAQEVCYSGDVKEVYHRTRKETLSVICNEPLPNPAFKNTKTL